MSISALEILKHILRFAVNDASHTVYHK